MALTPEQLHAVTKQYVEKFLQDCDAVMPTGFVPGSWQRYVTVDDITRLCVDYAAKLLQYQAGKTTRA